MKGNVVLIGMMGTFKSSAGRLAAKKMGMDFADTDLMIEEKSGKRISDIFKECGEEAFRGLEREVVSGAAKLDNCVIACGGGVVLDERNMTELKKNGLIILLTAPPERIYERVKSDGSRPVLGNAPTLEGITAVFELRKHLYARYGTFIIDNGSLNPEQTAGEIVEIVCQKAEKGV